MKFLRVSTVVAIAAVLMMAVPVLAQTTPEQCRLDSLVLVSPDQGGLEIRLSTVEPFGTILKWDDLDDAVSTCAVPVYVDTTIGFTTTLDGFYKDETDRKLNFNAVNSGVIGDPVTNILAMNWSNENLSVTGDIKGTINLSNNGGLIGYDATDDAWERRVDSGLRLNQGLPNYLSYTDMVGFVESQNTPGKLLTHLRDRLARGLWMRDGMNQGWHRIAADIFPDGAVGPMSISKICFSPSDDDVFLVGTAQRGVFITRDGGETFTQYQVEFSGSGSWGNRSISAVHWPSDDLLFVAINGLGLFRSDNGGHSYTFLEKLVVPLTFPTNSNTTVPRVNVITSTSDGAVMVGLETWGIYESFDDGVNWIWLWPELQEVAALSVSVKSIQVDPDDSSIILAGTEKRGLKKTLNHGLNWSTQGADVFGDGDGNFFLVRSVIHDPTNARYVAAIDQVGLAWSAVGSSTWSTAGIDQPNILNVTTMQACLPGGEFDYWLASYGGGIYEAGSQIRLSDTIIRSATDPEYRNLDLGLYISFGDGPVRADDPLTTAIEVTDEFYLTLQDYQGYAVWRSTEDDPTGMVLLGLYDKNNPEFCIEGYCGDIRHTLIPNCYVDKRAACFDFSTPGQIEFFDSDVYDGFVYNYAVTTFDYGNTATASPISLAVDQLFSERFDGDPNTRYPGANNFSEFRINITAADPFSGDDIFVFPNPLRQGLGFPNYEGEMVKFSNLPADSRVSIFTVDGDQVADLGPEYQEGHNLTWITRNGENELLASGVYIYKVEMPEREDYFGKLVIIR